MIRAGLVAFLIINVNRKLEQLYKNTCLLRGIMVDLEIIMVFVQVVCMSEGRKWNTCFQRRWRP